MNQPLPSSINTRAGYRPRSVAFVADEFHPFTFGGIGKMIHNQMLYGLQIDPQICFHLLVPDCMRAEQKVLDDIFGGRVRLHRFPIPAAIDYATAEKCSFAHDRFFIALENNWYRFSLSAALYLAKLRREGVLIDWVEFPDYTGAAYATLRMRPHFPELADLKVAVRVHSTWGMLVSQTNGVMEALLEPARVKKLADFEIERMALAAADKVICHIKEVGLANGRLYSMPDSWYEKLTVNTPYVPGFPASPENKPRKYISFTSYISNWKGPDIFVAAALEYFRNNPAGDLTAVMACLSIQEEYTRQVLGLIPAEMLGRFKICFDMPAAERRALLPASIVLIPSRHESYCLAAYEAAYAGAAVVLNGENPAFGPSSPWIDGVNCIKSKPGAEGFAAAIERALTASLSTEHLPPAGSPYWMEIS